MHSSSGTLFEAIKDPRIISKIPSGKGECVLSFKTLDLLSPKVLPPGNVQDPSPCSNVVGIEPSRAYVTLFTWQTLRDLCRSHQKESKNIPSLSAQIKNIQLLRLASRPLGMSEAQMVHEFLIKQFPLEALPPLASQILFASVKEPFVSLYAETKAPFLVSDGAEKTG